MRSIREFSKEGLVALLLLAVFFVPSLSARPPSKQYPIWPSPRISVLAVSAKAKGSKKDEAAELKAQSSYYLGDLDRRRLTESKDGITGLNLRDLLKENKGKVDYQKALEATSPGFLGGIFFGAGKGQVQKTRFHPEHFRSMMRGFVEEIYLFEDSIKEVVDPDSGELRPSTHEERKRLRSQQPEKLGGPWYQPFKGLRRGLELKGGKDTVTLDQNQVGFLSDLLLQEHEELVREIFHQIALTQEGKASRNSEGEVVLPSRIQEILDQAFDEKKFSGKKKQSIEEALASIDLLIGVLVEEGVPYIAFEMIKQRLPGELLKSMNEDEVREVIAYFTGYGEKPQVETWGQLPIRFPVFPGAQDQKGRRLHGTLKECVEEMAITPERKFLCLSQAVEHMTYPLFRHVALTINEEGSAYLPDLNIDTADVLAQSVGDLGLADQSRPSTSHTLSQQLEFSKDFINSAIANGFKSFFDLAREANIPKSFDDSPSYRQINHAFDQMEAYFIEDSLPDFLEKLEKVSAESTDDRGKTSQVSSPLEFLQIVLEPDEDLAKVSKRGTMIEKLFMEAVHDNMDDPRARPLLRDFFASLLFSTEQFGNYQRSSAKGEDANSLTSHFNQVFEKALEEQSHRPLLGKETLAEYGARLFTYADHDTNKLSPPVVNNLISHFSDVLIAEFKESFSFCSENPGQKRMSKFSLGLGPAQLMLNFAYSVEDFYDPRSGKQVSCRETALATLDKLPSLIRRNGGMGLGSHPTFFMAKLLEDSIDPSSDEATLAECITMGLVANGVDGLVQSKLQAASGSGDQALQEITSPLDQMFEADRVFALLRSGPEPLIEEKDALVKSLVGVFSEQLNEDNMESGTQSEKLHAELSRFIPRLVARSVRSSQALEPWLKASFTDEQGSPVHNFPGARAMLEQRNSLVARFTGEVASLNDEIRLPSKEELSRMMDKVPECVDLSLDHSLGGASLYLARLSQQSFDAATRKRYRQGGTNVCPSLGGLSDLNVGQSPPPDLEKEVDLMREWAVDLQPRKPKRDPQVRPQEDEAFLQMNRELGRYANKTARDAQDFLPGPSSIMNFGRTLMSQTEKVALSFHDLRDYWDKLHRHPSLKAVDSESPEAKAILESIYSKLNHMCRSELPMPWDPLYQGPSLSQILDQSLNLSEEPTSNDHALRKPPTP